MGIFTPGVFGALGFVARINGQPYNKERFGRLVITSDPSAVTFGGDISGSGAEDGGAINGTLTATDTIDGITTPNFTVTGAAGNGTASINSSTGAWTYTADANYNGSDRFTVQVTDDAGNNETQVIRITINQANDAATFGGDTSGSGSENGADITGTLTASDAVDGMTTPNFTVTGAASNGTADINALTGAWTYTADADFNGSDSFTVQVTDDDGNNETQVISITVNQANDAVTFGGEAATFGGETTTWSS